MNFAIRASRTPGTAFNGIQLSQRDPARNNQVMKYNSSENKWVYADLAEAAIATVGNTPPADYIGDTEAIINQAITDVAARGGGSIYIRVGAYTINEPIVLVQNITLLGDGLLTRLVGNGVSNIIEQSTITLRSARLSGLHFEGTALNAGIYIRSESSSFNSLFFSLSSLAGLELINSGAVTQFNKVVECNFGITTTTQIVLGENVNNSTIRDCLFNGAIGEGQADTCILDNGFSTVVQECLFLFPAQSAYKLRTRAIITDCIFVDCPICIDMVASDTTFGFVTGGVLVVGSVIQNFGNAMHFYVSSVDAGNTEEVIIQNISIFQPLGGATFDISGDGDHVIQITNPSRIATVLKTGSGAISASSFVIQPPIAETTEPSPTIVGTIYLDDGTNRTGVGYRRFNGASWDDL